MGVLRPIVRLMAPELVVVQGLRDTRATLERWNVINRVYPDEQLKAETDKFVKHLAVGPTKAHAATKAFVAEGSVAAADAKIDAIGAPLFETEDLKSAVDTFLAEGPGKATFKGR